MSRAFKKGDEVRFSGQCEVYDFMKYNCTDEAIPTAMIGNKNGDRLYHVPENVLELVPAKYKQSLYGTPLPGDIVEYVGKGRYNLVAGRLGIVKERSENGLFVTVDMISSDGSQHVTACDMESVRVVYRRSCCAPVPLKYPAPLPGDIVEYVEKGHLMFTGALGIVQYGNRDSRFLSVYMISGADSKHVTSWNTESVRVVYRPSCDTPVPSKYGVPVPSKYGAPRLGDVVQIVTTRNQKTTPNGSIGTVEKPVCDYNGRFIAVDVISGCENQYNTWEAKDVCVIYRPSRGAQIEVEAGNVDGTIFCVKSSWCYNGRQFTSGDILVYDCNCKSFIDEKNRLVYRLRVVQAREFKYGEYVEILYELISSILIKMETD